MKVELKTSIKFKNKDSYLNNIMCGDSEIVLDFIESNSIGLIYLDPPFFSNRKYQSCIAENQAYTFNDVWGNGIEEYMKFMGVILSKCHRVLSETGSLYLHCDWHASHYLKVLLDKIFGYNQFRNEIIWKRHNCHSDTKQGAKKLGRIHDVILFYSKTKKYTWMPIYQKYPAEYVSKFYRYTEKGTNRKYALGDLSGPGGKSKGNPYYTFLGVTRYWRYNKERMQKLYSQGKIVQSAKGRVPMLKRYLDEMKGIILQDIWDDIEPINSRYSTGYPTEKPIKLLERIIDMATNSNEVVLDPFCGSGTTLVAASNLGRTFVGIDISQEACKLAKKRLYGSVSSYKLRNPPDVTNS